ncbi:hypothetical protein ACFVH4_06980 [Nocardia ignorata]|uniref:hypothetical protein n=1 Tax=Nocardia ignorata TaxID=145285 RepID=UPI00363B7844
MTTTPSTAATGDAPYHAPLFADAYRAALRMPAAERNRLAARHIHTGRTPHERVMIGAARQAVKRLHVIGTDSAPPPEATRPHRTPLARTWRAVRSLTRTARRAFTRPTRAADRQHTTTEGNTNR